MQQKQKTFIHIGIGVMIGGVLAVGGLFATARITQSVTLARAEQAVNALYSDAKTHTLAEGVDYAQIERARDLASKAGARGQISFPLARDAERIHAMQAQTETAGYMMYVQTQIASLESPEVTAGQLEDFSMMLDAIPESEFLTTHRAQFETAKTALEQREANGENTKN